MWGAMWYWHGTAMVQFVWSWVLHDVNCVDDDDVALMT